MYIPERRYTEVATEISQVSRKRGRGAVPPVRIEKAERSVRSIDLRGDGSCIAKLEAMSGTVLESCCRECPLAYWRTGERRRHGRRIYGRRASAGEKNIGRVMKSRDSFTVPLQNRKYPMDFVHRRFRDDFFRAKSERFDCADCSLDSFGQRSTKICLTYFSLFSWFKFKIALIQNRQVFFK